MHLKTFTDVAAFKDAALPFLRSRMLHLNQLLSACERLTSQSAQANQAWLGCLLDENEVVGVAMCTSPLPLRNFFISDWPDEALPLLASAWSEVDVQAVIGPRATVEACSVVLGLDHLSAGLYNYVLQGKPFDLTAEGEPRPMTHADIPWLITWFGAFERECKLSPRPPDVLQRGFEEDLLPGSLRRCHIWMRNGEPVAMAGLMASGSIARIGPVYTPPEHRGQGYAGALVVHNVRLARTAGAQAVCLYADSANPVSNGLYRRIGFEMLSEFAHYDRKQVDR